MSFPLVKDSLQLVMCSVKSTYFLKIITHHIHVYRDQSEEKEYKKKKIGPILFELIIPKSSTKVLRKTF